MQNGSDAPDGAGPQETAELQADDSLPFGTIFNEWAEANALVGADPLEVEPGAILPNIAYYAMNLDPVRDSLQATPSIEDIRPQNGQFKLSLFSKERANDPFIEMDLEVTDNLANPWLPIMESPFSPQRVLIDPDVDADGSTQLHLYQLQSDQPQLFIRSRIDVVETEPEAEAQ